MRIHSENAEFFIHAIAVSIGKDPASLEGWSCAHISYNQESRVGNHEFMLRQLKKAHTDVDCDVVQCTDNDILLISRSLHPERLQALANEFINAASIEEVCVADAIEQRSGSAYNIALYDLFRDWRHVRDVLLAKTGKPNIAATKSYPYHFGEIASLSEAFAEAKKLRKARLPLHVMVVEDDPLTRRIVTSAFKENYALIAAENAQEAVANYLVHAPDIVFLDIGLPDASGFDVLHQIMASDKDAYVVMFSSNSYLDNVTEALSNGASGFVAKPFKKEKMRHYIQDSALHHQKYAS